MNCQNCNKAIKEHEKCFECQGYFCESSCLQDHGLQHLLQESNTSKTLNNDKHDKNSNISSHDTIYMLLTKGHFKDNSNVSYFYKNFEYVKIGFKNQLIGAGAYGDVFLAKHKVDYKKYAIKVMNKVKLSKNNIKESLIQREIQIHSKISHPYIIDIKCSHVNYEAFYLVMDYAKNGTLYSKIKKIKKGFSEETAHKYFIQTCSAIFFLHRNNYTHRDIKPENILLDENNNIKLTDFGWCESFTNNTLNDTCGTYEYMSPEILQKKNYNEKVDCWSLGILLYELLHGKPPFSIEECSNNPKELLNLINKNQYEIKNELSDKVKCLIKLLIEIDPIKRLSVKDIFEHPWIKDKEISFRSTKRVNTVYLKPYALLKEINKNSHIDKNEEAEFQHEEDFKLRSELFNRNEHDFNLSSKEINNGKQSYGIDQSNKENEYNKEDGILVKMYNILNKKSRDTVKTHKEKKNNVLEPINVNQILSRNDIININNNIRKLNHFQSSTKDLNDYIDSEAFTSKRDTDNSISVIEETKAKVSIKQNESKEIAKEKSNKKLLPPKSSKTTSKKQVIQSSLINRETLQSKESPLKSKKLNFQTPTVKSLIEIDPIPLESPLANKTKTDDSSKFILEVKGDEKDLFKSPIYKPKPAQVKTESKLDGKANKKSASVIFNLDIDEEEVPSINKYYSPVKGSKNTIIIKSSTNSINRVTTISPCKRVTDKNSKSDVFNYDLTSFQNKNNVVFNITPKFIQK